jgi:hypothetical protein
LKKNVKVYSGSMAKGDVFKKKMMKKKAYPSDIKIYNSSSSGGCGCGKKGF